MSMQLRGRMSAIGSIARILSIGLDAPSSGSIKYTMTVKNTGTLAQSFYGGCAILPPGLPWTTPSAFVWPPESQVLYMGTKVSTIPAGLTVVWTHTISLLDGQGNPRLAVGVYDALFHVFLSLNLSFLAGVMQRNQLVIVAPAPLVDILNPSLTLG